MKYEYGVYKIQNEVNEKIYFGCGDLEHRFYTNRLRLKNGAHHNEHLQNSWNKYGEENFDFSVVLATSKDNCGFYEKKFIDKYNTYKPKFGYNMTKGGEREEHTEETKEKMRGPRPSISGQDNPSWKGGKVTLECEICGDDYQVQQNRAGNSNTCSDEHRIEYLNQESHTDNFPDDLSGENNPNSKLTKNEVNKIRKLSEKGLTYEDLSSRFDVSKSLIGKIVRRIVWDN